MSLKSKFKILLFNPRSGKAKHRVPNSLMNIAASIDGEYEWVIVDGNRERDPYNKIKSYIATGQFPYVGFTVMPGPQLKQAIPFTIKLKKEFPTIMMIWGGYFASNQYKTVINSDYVDFVIYGPGDHAFPQLIDAIENNTSYETIKNLVYKKNGKIIKNPKENLIDQDTLPDLPYDKLDKFYTVDKYLGKTCLGKKTFSYHSSVGCPFTCSFCGVVPIYEARWKGKSAQKIYNDIKYIKDKWHADAVEFYDNNFFVSEKRVVEFCNLIKKEKMTWWGEGRIDTISNFNDETLSLMNEAGCKMIFFGAESGNDDLLKQMNKGGKQTSEVIKSFAKKIKKTGIIPEYSFVLGLPADTEQKVMEQIDSDIQFIKEIKKINPQTEIIIYIYSPVPTEDSLLYKEAKAEGFVFPQTLEEWSNPQWESFDTHRNPLTPWLTPEMVDKIHNFETVLNGYFPTKTDIQLNSLKRKVISLVSSFRYHAGFYQFPYEIKLLHKMWKYRQPEKEGF
ncbi:MAG: B12-binding domain-containing radical SAM protein [Chitinophagaceae bacterium]|nr:MAG: B12-binding domain-containing radical SAM protein [Chitinophagaceae bacterium]